MVIDHEIISTSFSSLPLNHSRRVVKYVHKVLVNRFALGRLAWFVFLASPDCCVALLQDAMGLSAVCDCGTGQPRYLKVQGNGGNTSRYPKFDIAKM